MTWYEFTFNRDLTIHNASIIAKLAAIHGLWWRFFIIKIRTIWICKNRKMKNKCISRFSRKIKYDLENYFLLSKILSKYFVGNMISYKNKLLTSILDKHYYWIVFMRESSWKWRYVFLSSYILFIILLYLSGWMKVWNATLSQIIFLHNFLLFCARIQCLEYNQSHYR